MSENRLCDYLDHIRQAASDACGFVEGLGKEDFLADKRTQQAVILSLVIIGEATTRLLKDYGDFLDRHPEVPWRGMKGMRNRIAHRNRCPETACLSWQSWQRKGGSARFVERHGRILHT